jgi:hypothetical protein
MDERWWEGPLRAVLEGRPAMLVGAVSAAWTPVVPVVREYGASDVLVIATGGLGAGPQPDARVIDVSDEVPHASMMERVRAEVAGLANLPDEAIAAIDEVDPHRTAAMIGSFLNTLPEVAGRPFLAYRWPAWVAYEDKTIVDALWDRAGIPHAPAAVVTPDQAHVTATALDEGTGTVWSGDAREGMNGGGSYVRWVVDEASAEQAVAFFHDHCDHVRVMPFLDGIPCSIHGIVLPDGVAALRPVEMVTLRRPAYFHYAGCSTFWDPDDEQREAMRQIARTTGERLRTEIGFRGAFTVDGVVTADGFMPTELNPRNGAGLHTMSRSFPELPLQLVLDLVVAGHDIGVTAQEFEAYIVERADAVRSGGTWCVAGTDVPTHVDDPLVFDDGNWRAAGEGEAPDGRLTTGHEFVRVHFDPARTPTGPSVGARAAAFYRYCDETMGTSFGELAPAPEVIPAR